MAKTKRTKPSPRAVASPDLVEAAKSPDYLELSKLCDDPWRPMKEQEGRDNGSCDGFHHFG